MMNPYLVLGVSKNSSIDEIKKTYRDLAKKYHPDMEGGDEEKFKEISDAYDILSNPLKRSKYDNQFNRSRIVYDDSIFEDIINGNSFNDIFNSRYGFTNGKASDVKANVMISIDEAYFGTNREIRLGLKTVNVEIKPGVKNGMKLRLKGLGQKGIKEELNGDLILTVEVLDDPNYFIDNMGLHVIKKINVFDALIGAKETVKVFNKTITFQIPECTESGKILRLKEKGFPIYENPNKYTDLLINIIIEFPTKPLDDEAKNMIKKIKDSIYEN